MLTIMKTALFTSFFVYLSVVHCKLCPGGTKTCDDNFTCCAIGGGDYGCCPLPNAVCCADDMHCCPEGYTCDSSGMCFLQNSENFTKLLVESASSVMCPGGSLSCPPHNTCCYQKLVDKYWCCPISKAVCCSGGKSCCPSGTSCDSDHFRCNKLNAEHLNKMQKVSLKQKDNFLENFLFKATIVKRVICPDQVHQCPENNTCCKLFNKEWGCCPMPNATCCDDFKHCCPNGSICDAKSQKCIEGSESIPWFRKQASLTFAPKDN